MPTRRSQPDFHFQAAGSRVNELVRTMSINLKAFKLLLVTVSRRRVGFTKEDFRPNYVELISQ